jgi:multisubunit Na+/H+ antiporter MnhC subunit
VSAQIFAVSDISAAPVIALIVVGVLIGIGGHMAHSRKVAAVGIAVLFVATALMLVGAYAAYNDDKADPRPKCSDPVGC